MIAKAVPGDASRSQRRAQRAPARRRQPLALERQQMDRVTVSRQPFEIGNDLRIDEWVIQRQVADVKRSQMWHA